MKFKLLGIAILAGSLAQATAVQAAEEKAEGPAQESRRASWASKPVENDGLAVIIEPTKDAFQLREAIALKITYRNNSKQPLRLPDKPALYNYWLLTLENVEDHTKYTGGTSLPMGMSSVAKPSDEIPPGESLEKAVTFAPFGFLEGNLDYETFSHTKFKLAPPARGTQLQNNTYLPPLPPGKYQLQVNIRFPSRPAPGADAKGVWKHSSILSEPVEIKVEP